MKLHRLTAPPVRGGGRYWPISAARASGRGLPPPWHRGHKGASLCPGSPAGGNYKKGTIAIPRTRQDCGREPQDSIALLGAGAWACPRATAGAVGARDGDGHHGGVGAPRRRRRLAPGTPMPPRHQRGGGPGGAVGAMVGSIVTAFLTVAIGFVTVVLGGLCSRSPRWATTNCLTRPAPQLHGLCRPCGRPHRSSQASGPTGVQVGFVPCLSGSLPLMLPGGSSRRCIDFCT
jgi:hypothetical protein